MSYRELKSYQQATAVYDLTVEFCARYINPKSRTTDQMEQAARSGKQNIVEGTAVSKTWPQNELKLLGVARGSLGELLEDYLDFLRQRGLAVWSKEDSRTEAVRAIAKGEAAAEGAGGTYSSYQSYRSDKSDRSDRPATYSAYKSNRTNKTYMTYRSYLDEPERAANMLTTLINQTNYLLDQQMNAIRNQLQEKGVALETRSQKLGRILAAKAKEEQELDVWAKSQMKKKYDL